MVYHISLGLAFKILLLMKNIMKVYEVGKCLTADHPMNCGFHIQFAHLFPPSKFRNGLEDFVGRAPGNMGSLSLG
jgi:hypothetical protein